MTIHQVPFDEFIDTVSGIADSFAGIHLEDIAASGCFEIRDKLSLHPNIPVHYDDQEDTAIVVLNALLNAAKVVDKRLGNLKVVINGLGASGIATGKLLRAVGIEDLRMVDRLGLVTADNQR